MAKTIREMSERAWRGEVNHEEIHPRVGGLGLEEVAEDLAFIHSFGNSVALRTAEGLVVVDTGSPFHMVTLLDSEVSLGGRCMQIELDPIRLSSLNYGYTYTFCGANDDLDNEVD